MALELTSERALIFRITHIENVPWILDHGLHCASSVVKDPNFRPIGDRYLIAKREGRAIPIEPFGTISDYVTFYFTPHSPMLLKITTGHGGIERVSARDIVVLVSSLHVLMEQEVPFLFTDSHASMRDARFFRDLASLTSVDWALIRSRNFARSVEDPSRMQRYEAEALAHRHVPLSALLGMACQSVRECGIIQEQVNQRNLDLKVAARPGWYF